MASGLQFQAPLCCFSDAASLPRLLQPGFYPHGVCIHPGSVPGLGKLLDKATALLESLQHRGTGWPRTDTRHCCLVPCPVLLSSCPLLLPARATDMHVHTPMCTRHGHAHTRTHTRTPAHGHAHTRVQTCTCLHVHNHTYMPTCTHTCM